MSETAYDDAKLTNPELEELGRKRRALERRVAQGKCTECNKSCGNRTTGHTMFGRKVQIIKEGEALCKRCLNVRKEVFNLLYEELTSK